MRDAARKLTIFLPDELFKKLKLKAAKEDTTMTQIVIKALEDHM